MWKGSLSWPYTNFLCQVVLDAAAYYMNLTEANTEGGSPVYNVRWVLTEGSEVGGLRVRNSQRQGMKE